MSVVIHNQHTIQYQDLDQIQGWLQEHHKEPLLRIISECFSGISAEAYFTKYFLSEEPFNRKLRLFYQNDKLTGYCLLTFTRFPFYQEQTNQERTTQVPNTQKQTTPKPTVIVGASAAFLPEFRQGGLTFPFSISVLTRYWLTHPRQRIVYADTMLSPAMYRAMARHVADIWPSPHSAGTRMPVSIRNLKESLINQFNAGENAPAASVLDEGLEDFRLWVGRTSNYSPEEVENFRRSNKPEFKVYCQHNPDFDKGFALLVIIPIDIKQFAKMAFKKFFRL